MNTITKLSIIVPVGKMAGNLDNLKAWISQISSSEIEVIIIHDVQDESTKKELRLIYDEFKHLRLLALEGIWGNPGEPRNLGLKHAIGEWVIFWDSDDIGYPEHVLESLKRVSSETEVIVGGYCIYNRFNGNCIMRTKDCFSSTCLAYTPGLWRILIRTKIAKSSMFPSIKIAEDLTYLIKIKIFDRSIEYSDKVFYKYSVNVPNQLTSRKDSFPELIHALIEINHFLSENLIQDDLPYNLMRLRIFLASIKLARLTNLITLLTQFRILYKQKIFCFDVISELILNRRLRISSN